MDGGSMERVMNECRHAIAPTMKNGRGGWSDQINEGNMYCASIYRVPTTTTTTKKKKKKKKK